MSNKLKSIFQNTWCGLPLAAWAVLLVTAVVSLLWSHVRILWIDEHLQFFTDSVPTFGEVLHIQRNYPVVTDPPVQHLFTHAFMNVFGRNVFALRLTPLLGYLLFQICLYLFVNRIAGRRSALLAMALSLATDVVIYAEIGRPYGLMMGLFALSLVCWQKAVRDEEQGRPRIPALLGLWLALAMAISTQFFGVFVLLPVWVGETARTIQRRRIDKAMATTLLLGVASMALVVPFFRGPQAYRLHAHDPMKQTSVLEIYRVLLVQLGPIKYMHRVQMLLLLVAALVLLLGAVLRVSRRLTAGAGHEWAALTTLALLPVFSYLLDISLVHYMHVRYVLPAVFAFWAGLAIVLQRPLQSSAVFYGAMAAVLGTALYVNGWNIRDNRDHSRAVLAGCNETPEVKAALDKDPLRPVYLQTVTKFVIYNHYEPDPALRVRLRLLDEQPQLQWENGDNLYIMLQYMRRFTDLPIVSYGDFLRLHDPLVVYYGPQEDGDTWLDRDLAARGRTLKTIGPWLGGTLAEVSSVPASETTP